MRESGLTTKIIRKLRERGGFWVKIHGGIYQQGGLPDIIGCFEGRFYGLEVKLPDRLDTLTPRQKLNLTSIRTQGGRAAVVVCVEEAIWVVFADYDIGPDFRPTPGSM